MTEAFSSFWISGSINALVFSVNQNGRLAKMFLVTLLLIVGLNVGTSSAASTNSPSDEITSISNKLDDISNQLNNYHTDKTASEEDYTLKSVRMGAQNGGASYQNELGGRYYYGEGVQKDQSEAVRWFKKAAEQGNHQAEVNLALCYYNGEGVTKDQAEAFKLFKKASSRKGLKMAAEDGNLDAMVSLGLCYFHGNNGRINISKATEWFKKAIDLGSNDADALACLGDIFLNSDNRDVGEAIKWFKKAADQGNQAAQVNLGQIYIEGDGVPKDPIEAAKWLKMAADQGNEDAQEILSWLTISDSDSTNGGPTTQDIMYSLMNEIGIQPSKFADLWSWNKDIKRSIPQIIRRYPPRESLVNVSLPKETHIFPIRFVYKDGSEQNIYSYKGDFGDWVILWASSKKTSASVITAPALNKARTPKFKSNSEEVDPPDDVKLVVCYDKHIVPRPIEENHVHYRFNY